MKAIFIVLTFCVSPFSIGFAQGDSIQTNKLKVNGRVALDYRLQSGNLQQDLIRGTIAPTLKNQRINIMAFGQYGYNKTFANLIQDDLFSYVSVGLFYQKRFYPVVFGMYENSTIRFINSRWLSGVGVGMNILQTRQAKFTMVNAIAYEETRFQIDKSRNYEVWRYSLALQGRYELFNEKIIVTHNIFYQPSLSDIQKNYKFRLLTVVSFPITKHLSVNNNFDYSYENILDVSRKPNSLDTSFGLSLHF